MHLVTALSNKMIQATFQQAAVYCLDRVKEIVGRNKFDHYLETFHPIIKKVNYSKDLFLLYFLLISSFCVRMYIIPLRLFVTNK